MPSSQCLLTAFLIYSILKQLHNAIFYYKNQNESSGNESECSERANEHSGNESELSERANEYSGNESELSERMNEDSGKQSGTSERANEGSGNKSGKIYCINNLKIRIQLNNSL